MCSASTVRLGLRVSGGWPFQAAALFVGLMLIAWPCDAEQGAGRMTEREQLLADLSKLGDQAYFGEEAQSVGDAVASKALASAFRGVLLGAPRVVQTDIRTSLPGVLISARTAARGEELPLHDNAIAAAVDIDSGAVMLSEAFPGDASKSPDDKPQQVPRSPTPSAPPRMPDADAALLAELGAGDSAGAATLDFRPLLHVPWGPSRLALWVIYFDQVSNPALVTLESKQDAAAPGWSAEAVSALVERIRAAGRNKHGYPRFSRSAETPTLSAPGAALTLGASAGTIGGEPLPAHGVVRVPLSRQMIVQSPVGAAAQPPAGALRPPSAVLRAMLLLVMKNRNFPVRMPLEIPVSTAEPPRPGDVVEATFAVDLADALPEQPLPGLYQVYLLAGPYLSGPHALTLSAAR